MDVKDMKINRRQFTLGSTTLLLSGMLPLKVNSSMLDNKKNLVVIMLRGAMDGLTSVPYIHDNTLEKVRPDIVVKKLLDLNTYFSASGIITFKNSLELQETFKTINNDRILIETDSPFLAPIPMRGKKNEPSYIKYTLEKLSELKSISIDDLELITTNNFEKLFS